MNPNAIFFPMPIFLFIETKSAFKHGSNQHSNSRLITFFIQFEYLTYALPKLSLNLQLPNKLTQKHKF